MALFESGEMYLESILVLSEKSGHVRAVEVSEYLGVSKPSVSRALGILREGGYIITEEDGNLILTDEGRAIAEKIFERHTILTQLLKNIGVSDATAATDACRIEHDISDETFERIKEAVARHGNSQQHSI